MPVLARAVGKSKRLTQKVKPGKQAILSIDRKRISESGGRVTDSLDMDSEYRMECPDEPRWDYLTGIQTVKTPKAECIVGIEVHPAIPKEVKVVIHKQKWAMEKVKEECSVDIVTHWFWIASGDVRIPATTTEFKLLVQAKIQLVGHLVVRSC